MTHWYHPRCGAYKRPEAFLDALPAATFAIPESEDLMAAARDGITHRRVPRINGAERDPSGRAHCRSCKDTIAKGTWRVPLVYFEEGRFVPSGSIHAGCAQAYFGTTAILARIRHFAPSLGEDDLAAIQAAILPPANGE